MCGIAGFVGGGGDETALNAMMECLRYRGPDDSGKWINSDERVFLGHTRLAIIDLDGGRQPMISSCGRYVIIFNGEIYNFMEVREKLQALGHRFLTDHSDTETILNGYKEWGREVVQRLNGMWACAIYDIVQNLIFLSRDRFGKKPLHYSFQNGNFVFASELKSLIKHPSIRSSVSATALKKYFGYGFIPAPHSIYENIFKLPGGHNLIYDCKNRKLETEKYWDFILEPDNSLMNSSLDRLCEELRYLLAKAVERRLVSDVPLGVLLSGGVDSSSIVAFASHLGEKEVSTFSIGFEESSFDESEYARTVAQTFKSNHVEEILSVDAASQIFPKVLDYLDEPLGDSSILPTYLLSRLTRSHVTVALSGDGGDELFAGYDPFKALKLAEIYQKLVPKPIHQAILLLVNRIPVSHTNISLDFKLKRSLKGLSYSTKLWNPIWLGSLDPIELGELFREQTDVEEVYEEAISLWDSFPTLNLVEKTLLFYTKLYLQDDILVKTDRASMMNSLEIRSPYLDIDLVNFVRHIPTKYKLRRGKTKFLLKRALEPILPRQILQRPKKGFGLPIGEWFATDKIKLDGYPKFGLNNEFVEKQIRQHKMKEEDSRMFLWNLLCLKCLN